MLRQGPISAFVHGAAEYVAAVLLIAAPFLFGFDATAATAVAIVSGVLLLVVTASSDLPTGLTRGIPPAIHVALDFALAVVLIASPFLFGFSDERAPTAFFLALGILHLLLTIATRFLPERAAA